MITVEYYIFETGLSSDNIKAKITGEFDTITEASEEMKLAVDAIVSVIGAEHAAT